MLESKKEQQREVILVRVALTWKQLRHHLLVSRVLRSTSRAVATQGHVLPRHQRPGGADTEELRAGRRVSPAADSKPCILLREQRQLQCWGPLLRRLTSSSCHCAGWCLGASCWGFNGHQGAAAGAAGAAVACGAHGCKVCRGAGSPAPGGMHGPARLRCCCRHRSCSPWHGVLG